MGAAQGPETGAEVWTCDREQLMSVKSSFQPGPLHGGQVKAEILPQLLARFKGDRSVASAASAEAIVKRRAALFMNHPSD